MNFYSLLQSGYNIAVAGDNKLTGAYFYMNNGRVYVYNKHIGATCTDPAPAAFNEHINNMLNENLTIVINVSMNDFIKSYERGRG